MKAEDLRQTTLCLGLALFTEVTICALFTLLAFCVVLALDADGFLLVWSPLRFISPVVLLPGYHMSRLEQIDVSNKHA